MAEEEFDVLFKIVIIGDSGVGKSNLLTRYTNNEFNLESKSTIGVEFATKTAKIGEHRIKAQIWDTSGQERYRAITGAYYRGAVGALLVYDITRQSSFASVDRWLAELRENSKDDVVVMLVGNKVDLADTKRQVPTEQAKEYAANGQMLFFETSALDATNVDLAFGTLFKKAYEAAPKTLLQDSNNHRNGPGKNTVVLQYPNPPNDTHSGKVETSGGCCEI